MCRTISCRWSRCLPSLPFVQTVRPPAVGPAPRAQHTDLGGHAGSLTFPACEQVREDGAVAMKAQPCAGSRQPMNVT